MANIFTLSITTRTAAFGEIATQERSAINQALQKVAQNVGSGAPLVTTILDGNGQAIGTAAFGVDSLNAS